MEEAVNQCEACGHMIYPNDPFDGDCSTCCDRILAQLAAVTAESERLREALEFYADEGSHAPYQDQDGEWFVDIKEDSGEIARVALKGAPDTDAH
jgi:hypothetical protein